jgi:hypothetical protein
MQQSWNQYLKQIEDNQQLYVLVFFASKHMPGYEVLANMPTLSIQVDNIEKITNLQRAMNLIDCSPQQCDISWPDYVLRAPECWSQYTTSQVTKMIKTYKQNIDGCWVIAKQDFDKLLTKEQYCGKLWLAGSCEHSEVAAYHMLQMLYQKFALCNLSYTDIVTGEHIPRYYD